MSSEISEIFSRRVKTDRRTCFLDVKQAADGSRFVSIHERKAQGGNLMEQRLIVAAEDWDQFREAVDSIGAFLNR